MEENYSLHKVCGDSLLPEHPPKAQFLMNFSIPWNIEMHLHVHSILIIEIALLVAQQCRAHNQLWRAWKRCAKWVPWRGDGAASGGETVRWEEGKCTFQCFQFLLIHCFASRSLVSRSENWFFLPLVFFFSLSSAFVLPLNDDDDGVDLRKYAWNDMHDAGWWWGGLIETTRNGNWKNKKIIVWVLLVVKEKNISLGKFTPARTVTRSLIANLNKFRCAQLSCEQKKRRRKRVETFYKSRISVKLSLFIVDRIIGRNGLLLFFCSMGIAQDIHANRKFNFMIFSYK